MSEFAICKTCLVYGTLNGVLGKGREDVVSTEDGSVNVRCNGGNGLYLFV